MSKDKCENHAKKYSQTYKKNFGVWKDDFDAMAKKTVLKLLLSKYAPMSVEMQKATMADQAVVNDFENDDYSYADNQPIQETKPLLDEDAEKSAIAEIKKGNTTYEDVAELYDLTDEQIKTLQHAGI